LGDDGQSAGENRRYGGRRETVTTSFSGHHTLLELRVN
jgi:hypothetical protein